MTEYSMSGYAVALAQREHWTVLMEGRADLLFVARILSALDCSGHAVKAAIRLDTTELIRTEGRALGAREIVEAIHASGKSESFAGWVDREFRKFLIGPDVRDEAPFHVVVDGTLFWTRGHSIENYLVGLDSIKTFLQLYLPQLFDAKVDAQLSSAYPQMLDWTVVLSLAALAAGLLSRFRSILSAEHWLVENERALSPNIEMICQALRDRGGDEASINTFKECVVELAGARVAAIETDTKRWIVHGHVAVTTIWSGVAAILAHHGAPTPEVEQVARGQQELKIKLASDSWVREHIRPDGACGVEAPAEFIAWLRSAPQVAA